jgi:hypothetical protein
MLVTVRSVACCSQRYNACQVGVDAMSSVHSRIGLFLSLYVLLIERSINLAARFHVQGVTCVGVTVDTRCYLLRLHTHFI